MSNQALQYQSAGILNYKALGDRDFLAAASKGYLLPLHGQLSPTNKCNISCPFCSYADCDRSLELSVGEIKTFIYKAKSAGMKAIDLTGGGEPLVHPGIDDIIDYIVDRDIKCGLTTNGLLIERPQLLNQLVWLRVSCSDDYDISSKFITRMKAVRSRFPLCDWSINYVVSKTNDPSLSNLRKAIALGKDLGCSHIRIFNRVSILPGEKEIDLSYIRQKVSEIDTKEMIVMIQDRSLYSPGADCYAGFVKPRTEADGYIYCCCGGQHAIRNRQERSMPRALRLVKAVDIEKLPQMSKKPFNGRICSRCYFSDFNNLLKSIMNPNLLHKEFI